MKPRPGEDFLDAAVLLIVKLWAIVVALLLLASLVVEEAPAQSALGFLSCIMLFLCAVKKKGP